VGRRDVTIRADRGQHRSVVVRVGAQHSSGIHGKSGIIEESAVHARRDDRLTVGVIDQAKQFSPTVRGIHTDDHRARKSGGTQPEEVVRRIVEKHPDMWWPVRIANVLP
jgi:hypothetical protein